ARPQADEGARGRQGMTPQSRNALWFSVGLSLGAAGIVAIVGVAVGEYGATFWRVIGMLVILFISAAAALAGLELIERRQLVPLGWWILATAPGEAVTLIVANWKEHVSAD